MKNIIKNNKIYYLQDLLIFSYIKVTGYLTNDLYNTYR